MSRQSNYEHPYRTNFERDLSKENQSSVQVLMNGSDGSKADIASVHAQATIQDFN